MFDLALAGSALVLLVANMLRAFDRLQHKKETAQHKYYCIQNNRNKSD
jgi:hypothetical protein